MLVVVTVQGQSHSLHGQLGLIQIQGRGLVHQEAGVVTATGHINYRVLQVGALVMIVRTYGNLMRLELLGGVLAGGADGID